MKARTAPLLLMSAMIVPCALIFGCGGGGSDDTVRLNVTRASQLAAPLLVAYQQGDGSWTQLDPVTLGKYEFKVTDTSGRYGVAVVNVENEQYHVRIVQSTRSTSMEWEFPANEAGGYTAYCSPINMPSNHPWYSSMFGEGEMWLWNTPVNLFQIPAGKRDFGSALFSNYGDEHAAKIILERDINVNGYQSMAVDFTASNAFAPSTYNIEATGTVVGSVEVYLATKNGTLLKTSDMVAKGTYAALPPNKRDPGDLYVALADETTSTTVKNAVSVFPNPEDVKLAMPEDFGNVTVTHVGGSNPLLMKAAWSPFANATMYSLDYVADTGSRSAKKKTRAIQDTTWSAYVSPGWIKGSATPSAPQYTLPDLSSLSGWHSFFNLNALYPVEWAVGAFRSNTSAKDALGAVNMFKVKNGMKGTLSGKHGTFAT